VTYRWKCHEEGYSKDLAIRNYLAACGRFRSYRHHHNKQPHRLTTLLDYQRSHTSRNDEYNTYGGLRNYFDRSCRCPSCLRLLEASQSWDLRVLCVSYTARFVFCRGSQSYCLHLAIVVKNNSGCHAVKRRIHCKWDYILCNRSPYHSPHPVRSPKFASLCLFPVSLSHARQ
jgi:hypothetical protein